MRYKVLIADDHPIFRAGIKEIINGLVIAELTGEASNGLEAYQAILAQRPDIAILDLEMPLLSGLDVCRKVVAEKHSTRFVILTMHKDRHIFEDAVNSGVKGYLLKDNAIDELVACIKAVGEGGCYYSKAMPGAGTGAPEIPEEIKALVQSLSPTEKIVLKLVAQSKTSAEIAESIFISPNTVDNHRANISRKLKLEGKNSLLKFALQYKHLF